MANIELSTNAYQFLLLQAQAYRAVRELIGASLDKHNLHFTQWLVLAHICRGPANGYPMRELAEDLSISPPQMTKLVTELGDRKLIRTRPDTKDQRVRLIRCSAAGKALCESIEADLSTDIVNWLDHLQASQQTAYLELLKLLVQTKPLLPSQISATIVTVKRGEKL